MLPLTVFAQSPTVGGCPVFPSNNVWNTRIDSLPTASNSATLVSTIGPSSPLHPDYGAGGGIPFNLISGNQPKVPVDLNYVSDAGPYPIPPNLVIQGEVDAHALIIDTTNCILYELFSLHKQSDGSWNAGSGAIFNLRSNALRSDGWTSADAAGLPIFPGLVRYDEVNSGHINHAIRFTAPQTRNSYIWPARHFASSLSGSQYPQFGQRFRLKEDVDISGFAPRVRVILQATKTYGMILADNGAPWHIAGVGDPRWDDNEMHQLTQLVGADFEAVDESSLIVDHNSGQAGGSTPVQVPGVPTGWNNVISKHSGKCLDLTGGPAATWSGDPAQQWTCVGGTNQEFAFSAAAGGYKITVRHSGKQLDMRGGEASVADGTLVQQWPWWGGSNEIFDVTPTGDGYYTIRPTNSGSCLDVRSVSQADGAPVQQWHCTGGDNQKWSFEPAN